MALSSNSCSLWYVMKCPGRRSRWHYIRWRPFERKNSTQSAWSTSLRRPNRRPRSLWQAIPGCRSRHTLLLHNWHEISCHLKYAHMLNVCSFKLYRLIYYVICVVLFVFVCKWKQFGAVLITFYHFENEIEEYNK